MTIKDSLKQYVRANGRIDAKLDEVSKLRALSTKVTSALSHETVSASPSDNLGNIVAKICDLEREVDEEIDSLEKVKEDVVRLIERVDDAKLREVLERRYINDQKWEEIAFKMGYDIRWIYRMHGMALSRIQKYAMESQY